eukprot:gene6798-7510_t
MEIIASTSLGAPVLRFHSYFRGATIIVNLDDEMLEMELIQDGGRENEKVFLRLNMCFGRYLQKLQRDALRTQYELACLSTLGGAYHLCKRPKEALVLSQRLEQVGHRMASLPILIRSKVFQAANWLALQNIRRSNACWKEAKIMLATLREKNGGVSVDMESFVIAFEVWLAKSSSS